MVVFDSLGENLRSSSPAISLIMYGRERPEIFKQSAVSLIESCSDITKIELICKFDYDDPTFPEYLAHVRWIHGHCKVHIKTVISDRLDGYWSIHTYLNDMFPMTCGKIIWVLGDDIMVGGDWFNLLNSTRNTFKDNIYVINTPGIPKRKTKMIAPAISREWIEVLGMVSSHPSADRLLATLATQCGRLITRKNIMNGISISHDKHKGIKRQPINLPALQIKENIMLHVKRLMPVITSKLKG